MANRLEITKPLRLIGIQVFNDTYLEVRKSIKPGWYPFIKCNGDIGESLDKYPQPSSDGCPQDFYWTHPDSMPRVSISAIAGKNGCGKSTILDMLYRILNNFAETTFLQNGVDETDEVGHAYGLHARLHFELDGVQKFIETGDFGTSYFKLTAQGPENVKITDLSEKQRTEILNSFFYTISINYSLYSLNTKDTFSPFSNVPEAVCDSSWLNNLFHKNDGYYIPIVLTPYREEGQIYLNNENELAEQRLTVLSLMFHSQKKDFLDDYTPSHLNYRFNYNYKEYKQNRLYDRPLKFELKFLQDTIIAQLEELWETALLELAKIELNPAENQKDETLLYYLAYKTFKICLTYPSFKDMSGIQALLDLKVLNTRKNENGDEVPIKDRDGNDTFVVPAAIGLSWYKENIEIFKTVIKTIYETPDSHITIKIQQCLDYLKEGRFANDEESLDVDADFLKGRRFETYNDMMRQLPPSFFITELRLKRKVEVGVENDKELTFRSMSSGERQMLYGLSYVFYHIKNIASIKENGKRVVGYHHINLIFDEAELYYHPEYQRQFVKKLLDSLAMCHINRTNIRSINILIVTHSPFILSDIPETNILFLRRLEDEQSEKPQKTLGANIYDLLKGGFFLDYAMGDLAQQKLQDILHVCYDLTGEEQKREYESKQIEFKFTVDHLGEEYLQRSFSNLLEQMERNFDANYYRRRLKEQFEYHKKQAEKLAEKLMKDEEG